MKTKEEILNHNLKAVCEIKRLQKQINVLKNKQRGIRKAIIPPCKHCPYDGVYRCEACQEDNYAGFNIKDYPRGY